MTCVFCEKKVNFVNDARRKYGKCTFCGGFFVVPPFLFDWCKKMRYERHNNSLDNAGYVRFLRAFIDPVLSFLPKKPRYVLDYGSGPVPALVHLLKNDCTFFPECVKGWDPFFASDTTFFENGADLITCLETAEHFENPAASFTHIRSALAPDGYVAIGTQPVPSAGDFLSWWYKEDPCHVAFYTEKALQEIAKKSGLCFVCAVTERVFVLKRKN